jgi:syntaxin 1B/2/3
MDVDIAQVTKIAKSIKLKLEDLDRSNASNRRVRGCEEGTPTDRTRTSITGTLRKKLKDLMGEFQTLRQKMMEEYKETVERRYYTVTGEHADDDTIEHIIETGNSETFLQKAIQEQGRGQVLETIKEIQERHDAVKDIERNLIELHSIFMDMATLVEAQGEQLNNIESHVNKASSFIDRGTQQLKIAKDHQRNTRKWMCIGIALVIILILIILLPILKSVGAFDRSAPPPK